MNHFRLHIPDYVDFREPAPEFPFETTADLLALPVVAKHQIQRPTWAWCMSKHNLLHVSPSGLTWGIVGSVEQRQTLDLPNWSGWKFMVRFENGVEAVVSDEVHLVCGGQATLIDGRVATIIPPREE